MLQLEIGYLLADTLVLLVDKHRPDPFLLIHHVVLAAALPYLLWLRIGDYYVAGLFLMNASTPVLHARWAISKSRWRGGLAHSGVTILLLCIFVSCRIAIWPILFGTEARRADRVKEAREEVGRPKWYCMAAALAFICMNGTWVLKLLQQSLRQELGFLLRRETNKPAGSRQAQ
jgi:hypothetical protein